MQRLIKCLIVFVLVCCFQFCLKAQKPSNQLNKLAKEIDRIADKAPDSLQELVNQGMVLATKEKQFHLLVHFKHLLGLKAFKEADYKKAVQNYLEGIKIGEQQKASPEFVHLLYDASEVYRRINIDTSMSFVRKGLLYARNQQLHGLIASGYNRLGYAFEIRNKIDSAMYYYQKGLAIDQKNGNDVGTSYAYESIAGIFNKQSKSDKAIIYLKKSYALRKKVKDEFAQAISLINIGETYKILKQTDSAIFYANKANDLATKIKFYDLASYSNGFLSDLYKGKGNYKLALQYKERNIAIKDSIFSIEKNKQINELDRKYQTEKRIQQINNLKQEAIITNLKIEQRNIGILILGVLLLAVIVITRLFINRRQMKAKVELQEAVMRQQDIASKAVLEAEERERRRIAGDLHDGVGQLLSAALMNFNALLNKLDLSGEKKLQSEKTLSLVTESYDEMRSISHQMMPNALIKSGLAFAVKEFISKIDKEKLKVSLETVGLQTRLDDQVETVIYRIIQESVNNVIKHSKANCLDIQIIKEKQGVDITIEDNGEGFDKSKIDITKGIGLGNMHSRVAFLKGEIEIDTSPGKGTLLAIHIPL